MASPTTQRVAASGKLRVAQLIALGLLIVYTPVLGYVAYKLSIGKDPFLHQCSQGSTNAATHPMNPKI